MSTKSSIFYDDESKTHFFNEVFDEEFVHIEVSQESARVDVGFDSLERVTIKIDYETMDKLARKWLKKRLTEAADSDNADKKEQWLKKNAEAIASFNKFTEEYGLFSESLTKDDTAHLLNSDANAEHLKKSITQHKNGKATKRDLSEADNKMIDKEKLQTIIESRKVKLDEELSNITDPANEEVVALASELYDGDLNNAVQWLLSPIRALSGDAPVDRLHSEQGRKDIINIIGRIDHGIFS